MSINIFIYSPRYTQVSTVNYPPHLPICRFFDCEPKTAATAADDEDEDADEFDIPPAHNKSDHQQLRLAVSRAQSSEDAQSRLSGKRASRDRMANDVDWRLTIPDRLTDDVQHWP